MTHDTPLRNLRQFGLSYVALLSLAGVAASVTFVLSFYGLRDYGWRVAGIPPGVAWLVPIGVDVLQLVAVASTYVLRDATYRVRLYSWFVFGVAVAASVAGNLSHAAARHLSYQGQVGAAAWPLLLALATHLLIVTRRHLERRVTQAPVPALTTPIPEPVPVNPKEALNGHVRQRPEVPRAQASARQRVQGVGQPGQPAVRREGSSGRSEDRQTAQVSDQSARAVDLLRRGRNHDEIAAELGVSKKTAERYTRRYRAGRAREPATDAA